MEESNEFLEKIKKLQYNEEVDLSNILGIITNIKQVEFETFKLSIKIENIIYCGIYLKYNNKAEELKEGDYIKLFEMTLVKNERKIKLYSSIYKKKQNIQDENIIQDVTLFKTCDLNPSSFITTICTITNIKYQSDFFIIREKSMEYILIPISEEKELSIKNRANKEKLKQFLKENELKDNSLIYIENYLLEHDSISFNNLTLFNKVKLEYIDEYIKSKFKFEYKNDDIFQYKINSIYNKINFILLKVVDIQDKFILGIDIFSNIYKIDRNSTKIKEIQNIYEIILLKNYNELIIQDSFLILSLNEKTYIHIIENSFCNSIINNLSIINLNFLDYIDKEKNYFKQIRFSGKNEDISFEIVKQCEYFVLFTNFNLIKNYYVFTIKLVSQNSYEIRIFQFIIYYGLLNKINCLINYIGKESYGCEFFYYNFNYDLPKFQIINYDGKKLKFEINDDLNSKSRKRFVILNYSGIQNMNIYKNKIKEKNEKEEKNKENMDNKNEIITINNRYNLNDILNDKEGIPEISTKTSFLFIFSHEKGNNNLLGVYDINEINNYNDLEKNIYKQNDEYKTFFNFFKTMNNKNINMDKKNNYLKSLEKYINNDKIEQLVKNGNYDFSFINYENYIVYINICLFYYYNKTSKKEGLIKEFGEKFNLLKDSNLSYFDRIRIMRFTCKEYFRISDEYRVTHLILLDDLLEDNSYKIAINFNKKMINELEENSQLFIPFIQLDSYILYNYKKDSYSFTLSLEPLIITKKHLLSSYDDFIFTYKEKSKNNQLTLAIQCTKNDVTAINEYSLFPSNDNCDSKELCGNDIAVPISVILLHERNGHSKKDKKNKRNPTPLCYYKENEIAEINKKYQKTDKLSGIIKGEAGHLVDSFISYKTKNLNLELIKNHTFGNIMNNVKLFTSKTFEGLANEIKKKTKKKSFSFFDKFKIENVNKNEIPNDSQKINENDEKLIEEKEPPKESLEYYEKNYLFYGKIFVYPYSIPMDDSSSENEEKEISIGRKKYLEKYKDAIIQGRKRHYGEDYED